jgi:hypothetical protein
VLFKGFYTALEAGSLASPDIRHMLVMSSFSGETEEDAVTLSDITTLDEFDGIGYAQLDAASVTTGYVDADDEWQLDHADGDFGTDVAPGSDDIYGMLTYLYVDGDPANDIVLGFTKDGGFGVNANNGALTLTLPAGGLLFIRAAA